MSNRTYNYKKWYPVLKWVLALLSVGYLTYQWVNRDIEESKQIVVAVRENMGAIALVLVLMFVNWSLESIKFRKLLPKDSRPGKLKSFFTIMAGTTISNFTPAKTGDYIGRTVIMKDIPPLKVVLATISGNVFQLLTTYVVGLASLIFAVAAVQYQMGEDIEYNTLATVVISALTFVGVLVLVIILYIKFENKFPDSIRQSLEMVRNYSWKLLSQVLSLSVLRYITFNLQFFILLYTFSDSAIPLSSVAFLPAIFLLQSVVPVPAVTDLGLRLYFTSIFFEVYMNSSQITASIVTLWTVNLVIPALIGAVYLLFSLVNTK